VYRLELTRQARAFELALLQRDHQRGDVSARSDGAGQSRELRVDNE
jgi:hypothetical protein